MWHVTQACLLVELPACPIAFVCVVSQPASLHSDQRGKCWCVVVVGCYCSLISFIFVFLKPAFLTFLMFGISTDLGGFFPIYIQFRGSMA